MAIVIGILIEDGNAVRGTSQYPIGSIAFGTLEGTDKTTLCFFTQNVCPSPRRPKLVHEKRRCSLLENEFRLIVHVHQEIKMSKIKVLDFSFFRKEFCVEVNPPDPHNHSLVNWISEAL